MSKSDQSDYSRINLNDDADTISQKIRKAKTDPDPLPETMEGLTDRPEARNLVTIYAALADCSSQEVLTEFAGKGFGVFKPALVDMAVAKLAPVTTAMRQYMDDQSHVRAVLDEGAERAHAIARPIMQDIRERLGFLGTSLG
jgi:tryptophanyl-tRNA synthetase